MPDQPVPPGPGDIAPGRDDRVPHRRLGLLRARAAPVREIPLAATRRSRCTTRVPFGKLFRLDGHFMTSERDEFFYHENLVHMAARDASAARARADRRRRRRRLGRGAAEAPVDQVGDARRDRPRGRRHLAQVSAVGAPRRARRSAARAAHRGRLRLRAQRHRHFDLIVLDLTDPGGPSLAAVHAGVLPRVRGAPDADGRADAAHRKPGRASGAHSRHAREPARGVRAS